MRFHLPIINATLLCCLAMICEAGQEYRITAIDAPAAIETVHKSVDDAVILKPVPAANIKCDGLLDEPQWTTALQLGPLGRLKALTAGYKGRKADDTYVRMFCDGQNLYIAAILHEADMGQLRESIKLRDGALWSDDCFELFIDPHGLRKEYCHLIVNPSAVVFDAWIKRSKNNERDTDVSWNPTWKKAVSKQADRWIVEIVLPLNMFASPASDFWVMNLAREQARNTGLACWADVTEFFHSIDEYKLVCLKQTSVVPRKINIKSFVYGKNVAHLELKNLAGEPVAAKLFARVNGKQIASADIQLKANMVSSFDLKFDLKGDDFGGFMQLGCDSGSGEIIFSGMQIPQARPVDLHTLTGLVCLNQEVKLKGQLNISAEEAGKHAARLQIFREGVLVKIIKIESIQAKAFHLAFATTGLDAGKHKAVIEVGQNKSSDVSFEIIPGPFD